MEKIAVAQTVIFYFNRKDIAALTYEIFEKLKKFLSFTKLTKLYVMIE